jgi:Tol biopolymer transport system component
LQSQAGNYIYDFFEETLETLDTVNKNTLTLLNGPGATFLPTCCGMDLLGAGSPSDTPGGSENKPTATPAPTSNLTGTSKEGKLVYVSGIGQRRLIVNDLPTGKQTVITAGPFKQVDFNLAPKGDKMVYVEVGDRFNSTLYMVGLDGTHKQKLSEGNGNPDDLTYLTSWSADGKQLAFQALNDDKQLLSGLYTVSLDSTTKTASEPRLITDENVSAFAWSPDGSQLAYRIDSQTYQLFISPADGSRPGKRIASLGLFDTRYSSLGKGLAWSPDGRYLVMSGAGGFSTIWEVWLITPQGKVDEQPGYYINRILGFSPDSSRLIATVASSNQTSTIQAYVLGNNTNIARGWRSYDRGTGPVISPDSQYMAYYSQGGDSRFDGSFNNADTWHRLLLLSFSTGNSRPITLDYMPYYAYKARFFCWEPGNGQTLIYYQNNTIYGVNGQGQTLKSEVVARAFSVDRLGWSKG